MSIYELTLLLHIILFVYWLGGDLGVYVSSKFVVDPNLSKETRLIAAKIMLGCDLIPKICMSLMLTVGGVLTHYYGVEHPLWQMLGIILLGPVWLSMVLVLHYKHGASFIPRLTTIDFYFRWVLIACIIASCTYAYTSGRLSESPWIIVKLLLFAFLIFCGLMIRIKIKPFMGAFGKIASDAVTDADNQVMLASLKKVRPWVYAIWIVLVIEAGIGIVKPGDNKLLETHAKPYIQELFIKNS